MEKPPYRRGLQFWRKEKGRAHGAAFDHFEAIPAGVP
jgi:hypothetical protein